MKKLLLILLCLPMIGVGQIYAGPTGCFSGDCENGKGIFIDDVGNMYIAEFIDGVMNGKITINYANDDKYIGEFKDGKRHGQGAYTSSSGKIQEGIWKYNVYKQLNSPYKLSEGVIDHRLFRFIESENFQELGEKNLYRLININKIKIDSNIVIGITPNVDGYEVCVAYDLIWNKDIFYFTEGKVLIIQRHYDGDFESEASDWYDFFLYDSKQLKFKAVFSTSLIFEYNYDTDYIVSKYTHPCSWEDYFLIYNNKLEMVKYVDPWNDRAIDSDEDYTVSWNKNKSNDILFINNNKVGFRVYENKNKEWILLKEYMNGKKLNQN